MAGITQATPSKTIAQVVVATPELSTLLAAAKAAGLVGALSGKGPLTVFAPTNAAFKELGAAVPELLKPANHKLLVKVILYHVVAGNIPSTALKSTQNVPTLEKQQLTVTKDAKGVYVNGQSKVTTADIMASNGVVHIINQVLLFPGFKLPTASTPAAGKGGKGGGTCSDDVAFHDNYGSCKTYVDNKWCAYGAIGPGWQTAWGGLSAAALKACCACGGGTLGSAGSR